MQYLNYKVSHDNLLCLEMCVQTFSMDKFIHAGHSLIDWFCFKRIPWARKSLQQNALVSGQREVNS